MRPLNTAFGLFGWCVIALAQQNGGVRLGPVPVVSPDADLAGYPANQFVYLNPQSAEYIVVIRTPDGRIDRLVHAPLHNGVAVGLTSSVSRGSDGLYHYRYSLSNGTAARQSVQRWALAVEEVGHQVVLSHPSWRGAQADTKLLGISRDRHEVYQWTSPEGGALGSGSSITGFEIVSDLAPGYILGAFYGMPATPELALGDWASLPQPAAEQLRNALGTAWDAQSRQMIGPRFTPGAELEMVEANFLHGVRDLKANKRITKDSVVGDELESTLKEALSQPGGVDPTSSLESLNPAAGTPEGELVAALRLTLAALQAGR
jgi:hypothetical protein